MRVMVERDSYYGQPLITGVYSETAPDDQRVWLKNFTELDEFLEWAVEYAVISISPVIGIDDCEYKVTIHRFAGWD
jgi:hypothetical protein